jgi:hypothetical protein
MPGKKSASFPAPPWWLSLAQPAVLNDVAVRDGGQKALAIALAERVGRKTAFDHGYVSRFIASGSCPLDFALAVSAFFGIPPLVHIPRSVEESMEMGGVKAKYDLIIARTAGRAAAETVPLTNPATRAGRREAQDSGSHRDPGAAPHDMAAAGPSKSETGSAKPRRRHAG